MARRVALDTNLALLLAVGLTNRDYVSSHKRLSAYGLEDFDLLVDLLSVSAGIVFCPNVVSETSNLIRFANEPMRSAVAQRFAAIIKEMGEIYIASSDATEHASYKALGVTDAVLLTIAATGAVLLTDDLPLYVAALNAELPAENFAHERDRRLYS